MRTGKMSKYVIWFRGSEGVIDRIEKEAEDIDVSDGCLTGYEFDSELVYPDGAYWQRDLWAYAPGEWIRVERMKEYLGGRNES